MPALRASSEQGIQSTPPELAVVPPRCEDFSHKSTSSDFFEAKRAAAMPAQPLPSTIRSRSSSHCASSKRSSLPPTITVPENSH